MLFRSPYIPISFIEWGKKEFSQTQISKWFKLNNNKTNINNFTIINISPLENHNELIKLNNKIKDNLFKKDNLKLKYQYLSNNLNLIKEEYEKSENELINLRLLQFN